MDWKGRHKWFILTRKFRTGPQAADLAPLPEGSFPVYPMIWHPGRTRRTAETDPNGRVVGVEYSYDYQPSDPAFQSELGPNDVVWVPLYRGSLHWPVTKDEPRDEHKKNLEAIAQLGPKVRAILVGNANAEIHYDIPRAEEYERAVRFIEKHAAIIRPHGRPAFAPIFELLLLDCYQHGGRMRDILNRNDALVLSFAGCSWLFEKKHPRIPEASPFPQLKEYLSSLHAWSGVGLQRGLDAGSDKVLAEMGYKAGFMGSF